LSDGFEWLSEEGRGQAEYPNELGHPGAGESLAAGDVRWVSLNDLLRNLSVATFVAMR
jgi:hypothetical protein